MVQCVEQRLGDIRATRKVQWLIDNASSFAALENLEIAAALNLEPCLRGSKAPEQRHGQSVPLPLPGGMNFFPIPVIALGSRQLAEMLP